MAITIPMVPEASNKGNREKKNNSQRFQSCTDDLQKYSADSPSLER